MKTKSTNIGYGIPFRLAKYKYLTIPSVGIDRNSHLPLVRP